MPVQHVVKAEIPPAVIVKLGVGVRIRFGYLFIIPLI